MSKYTKPTPNQLKEIKGKLNVAFRNLRKAGYFAKQNFWCCQSCGCSAVPDSHENKYVFYHRQDNDCLVDSGGCYMAWDGDGEEISRIFREAGLQVKWDGSGATRIEVFGETNSSN